MLRPVVVDVGFLVAVLQQGYFGSSMFSNVQQATMLHDCMQSECMNDFAAADLIAVVGMRHAGMHFV